MDKLTCEYLGGLFVLIGGRKKEIRMYQPRLRKQVGSKLHLHLILSLRKGAKSINAFVGLVIQLSGGALVYHVQGHGFSTQ